MRGSAHDPDIDYTVLPAPPAARSDYEEPIYSASTRNPPVFLAIKRIGQKNTHFLDFRSATDPLPNLAPTDPLRGLSKGVFVGDLWHNTRSSDREATVVLLPHFYSDNRHALGYYMLGLGPNKPMCKWMRTALCTPCTTDDLEDWNMIAGGDGSVDQGSQIVGTWQGRWVAQDIVEDYEEWCAAYAVVGHFWQTRVEYTMGVGESGTRWKGI